MTMPGFTAAISLGDAPGRYRLVATEPGASHGNITVGHPRTGPHMLIPQQSESTHTLLCALAFQDCVTKGLCDWYFANCPQPSGGGGGDNGGLGGGARPPGPIHIA